MGLWRRLRFEVPRGREDALGAWLEETASLGSCVRAVAGDREEVEAYYPESGPDPAEAIRGMARRDGVAIGPVRADTIPDGGWEEAYQRSLKPFPLGDRFVVLPGEAGGVDLSRMPLRIVPGRAFGTGEHPTTALCVEFLERRVRPAMHVLDVGTGSGILAIAAARLGASRVVAVEPDREAVAVAAENLRANGVAARVELILGTTADVGSGWFDLLAANILAGTLIELMPELAFLLRPGGAGVLSGLQQADREPVRDAAAARGLREEGWRESSGWVALEVAKPLPVPP
ncbi:MAG: 50S ribosomal protein L11 methyltransferase [Acidobacteriota bacterium]|jgi:ribosomal protein L11 methyltransferase